MTTMRMKNCDINLLFKQLGLDDDDTSIYHFLKTHSPLNSSTAISEAKFWNKSQRTFIKEELAIDSEWSEVIDQLSLALR